MKNKSSHIDRDVLMEDLSRREPRVRASVLGDKKVSAGGAEKFFSPRVSSRGAVAKPSVGVSSVEKTSARVEFDDALMPRTEPSLRREHGYNHVSPQTGLNRGGKNSNIAQENGRRSSEPKRSAVDDVRLKVTRNIIFRSVLVGLLVCGFAAIAFFAAGPVTRLLERPLKSVAVEGQFQFLSKNRAMELINTEVGGNFLQLNLDHLKTALEADPWVEHVYLSRRWPDTLVVKIAEQKPIARWDANGFLNQRGEIVRVKDANRLQGLPLLQGNEINAHEIMQQYQDLSTLLRARGLEIVALKCDNKKSWVITLKNDIEIAVGRDQVMEKLNRFVSVYDKFLSSVWSNVKAIDVRYTNGVAVRWLPDSDMAKKYLKPDIAVVHK